MVRPSHCFLLINLLSLAIAVLGTDKYSRDDFPPDFIFGSGTSAYQVEGAANEDGRTPSIWDTFAHSGYAHGANGDVACDGYHKYKEDVQLMADTGLDAYRFSISWSRLIPNGRGPVNPKGLQYYNNLVNELISHGIQPHVTLHNYDLPQALEDEYGGWINRTIVKDFTAYADVCFREFGDRVSYWTTVNEPNVFVVGGYDQGIAPPRHCSPPFGINCSRGNSSSEPYIAAHNILLAHTSAATLYKQRYQGKQHGFIGVSIFAFGFVPLTNSMEDVIATQRAYDFIIGWVAHPLVFGDYPSTMKKNVGTRLPVFTNHESEQVKGSIDFLGVIHYNTFSIKDNPSSLKLKQRDFNADMAAELILKWDNSSADGLPIMPWGLQGVLEYFKQVYGNPPIYIHENEDSTQFIIGRHVAGEIFACIHSECAQCSEVKFQLNSFVGYSFHDSGMRKGWNHHWINFVPLPHSKNGSNARGYFTWSFLDVFELLDGYESGYGLYYVDQDDRDLKRYPKLSAHWYSHFLKGGGISSTGVIELEKNQLATSSSRLNSI